MADEHELVTAEQMDTMTPDERAAAVREHIVTDLDELPPEVRARFEEAGRQVARDLGMTSSG